ncbi:hypothetical protein GTA08_BOTSDO01842 [Neofusicoccum parvum]|uniref:Uncharacterized protein n=1 Tax=Neofusicoccum parvum TaxID=310453 RepID=A0ACB5SAB5_9PEZI|nr:hypothetical protein GTA08_BOTSDO01842 [Neofusicoccum parvum]
MIERHRISVQQRIPFMELPTEIRIQIYEELFKSPVPFELADFESEDFLFTCVSFLNKTSWTVPGPAWLFFRSFVPALKKVLCLNKTINREAAEVFYSANEFRFSGSYGWITLNSFLSTIGSSNFQFIKSLTVHVPFIKDEAQLWAMNHYSAFQGACQKLGRFKALKKLRFLLPCHRLVEGPYDYFRDKLVCDETCDRIDNHHLRTWHNDRFFWTQLDNLRDKIPELDISIVLLHDGEIYNQGLGPQDCPGYYRRNINNHEWFLYRAKSKGYSFGYAIGATHVGLGEYFAYEVVDGENVMELCLTDWEFPTATSPCAVPTGDPAHEPSWSA